MSLPPAYVQIVDGVAEAIAQAIQTFVNKPKRARFQHPRFRSGMYWRQIRNRTRKLHRQMVYKYVKLLYQLHTYLKTLTYQQHHSTMNDKHSHSNTGKQDERTQSIQRSPMGFAHKDDQETKSKAETNKRKRQRKPKEERLQDRQRTVFKMHAPSATHIEPNANC